MARSAVITLWLMGLSMQSMSADFDGAYDSVAAYCGIPVKILYAVSTVERGRRMDGDVKPWPWTLNIDGEAFYFDSREEQFKKLMEALSEKRRTVGIGLMQMDWRWKAALLHSPWLATDPTFNLKTGCQIIRAHYDKTNDWWIAVGKYHRESSKPKHVAAAQRYAARVYRRWEKLQ